MTPLSIQFENYMKQISILNGKASEEKFLDFVTSTEALAAELRECKSEACRLQKELMDSQSTVNSLQIKLKTARHLLEVERSSKLSVLREKDRMEGQIAMVCDMLNKGNIDETKEKLQCLSNTLGGPGYEGCRQSLKEPMSPNFLPTITEDVDTLGSIIDVSDIDITEGDDLEVSKTHPGRTLRRSSGLESRSSRKRKSSPMRASSESKRKSKHKSKRSKSADSLRQNIQDNNVSFDPSAPPLSTDEEPERKGVITSKVAVTHPNVKLDVQNPNYMTPKHNVFRSPSIQITTPSSITYSPYHSPLVRNYSCSKVNLRPHSFASKSIYWTEFCQPCGKRFKFGKVALKCRDCKATCHGDCREAVPLPCIPSTNTPGSKGEQKNSIADFAPPISPMVPALIVHCTNEIENRGLSEVGLYRVNGSEKEVGELKERFLRGKGMPNLSYLEIPVLCGTVKDFLRNLKEPLVTYTLWRDFVSSTQKNDQQDSVASLYQTISELPQPNRDTLAWMIYHLQRIAECSDCKMPKGNLAKIFGPTIVGYSVAKPDPPTIIQETILQQKVMENLLDLSSDYWSMFIHLNDENFIPSQNATPEAPPGLVLQRRSIISKVPLGVWIKNNPRP